VSDGAPRETTRIPGLDFPEARCNPKMIEHRAAIVRYEDTFFCSCTIKEVLISNAVQTCLLGRHKVNRRLTRPNGFNDCELKIVVCLEANTQDCGSPCPASALAR
jgi:hypothetical protein